jgi:hypothetical protein
MQALPPLPRSVSTSRQFIVYSSDTRVRAALCNAAERAKSNLLGLLRQPDQWKTPIVVNAQSPQANLPELPAASLNFSQTGSGLKLQLNLMIGADLNSSAIERELLRVVLLEMMYRRQPNLPVGTPYVQPPEWLLDGVLTWGSQGDPTALGALLKTPVAEKKDISFEDFLQQRPELLDSPSRAVYRAYSFALVSLLTGSRDDDKLLVKFIADLSESPNDPAADLIVHFPKLGGSIKSAQRVWKSSVMQLAALQGYESLTVAEAERRLDTVLHFQFPRSKEPERFWSLEDYSTFIRFPERAVVLKRVTEDLMVIGARANPMSRAVVREYQEIASMLARGKTRGIGRRLARVKSSRQILTARVQQIDDYMNWFEATQSRDRSGTFTEYLKAADKPAASRRRDAISVYLDALETQIRD